MEMSDYERVNDINHSNMTAHDVEMTPVDRHSSEESINNEHSSELELISEETLGFLDKYLTFWILIAMVTGVLIGYFVPPSSKTIYSWSTNGLNWPIAIGLIMMIWPPLARVKYDRIWELLTGQIDSSSSSGALTANRKPELVRDDSQPSMTTTTGASSFQKVLSLSLILNWIVGPFLMFFLAIACLPDNHIHYIRGLILIGIARCIGMVVIWINLSSGSIEYATILVCLNSIFQIVFYSFFAYFFISVFLPLFQIQGQTGQSVNVSFELVAESVAIYLGIPFSLGFGCWLLFNRVLGTSAWKSWYNEVFIPKTSPIALLSLLFTILVMFILQGEVIVSIPLNALRVAVPLVVYFTVMFLAVYYLCYKLQYTHKETITLAFTSASNNFELAIAISIALFGLDSPEAFVGVIGALVEVPVMLTFVHMIELLHRWFPTASAINNNIDRKYASTAESTVKMILV
jgi:arsenite transporter